MRALVLVIAALAAASAHSQVCTNAFTLRDMTCPAGGQTCSTKGDWLEVAEFDRNLANVVLACEAIDTAVCLSDGTNCPAGSAIPVSATPPASPAADDLWIDSSQSPSTLCIYDGSDWRAPQGGRVCAGEVVRPTSYSASMYLHAKLDDQPAADGFYQNSGGACPATDCLPRTFTTPSSREIDRQYQHVRFGAAAYFDSAGTINYRAGCEMDTVVDANGNCEGLRVGSGGADGSFGAFSAGGYFRFQERTGTAVQYLLNNRDTGSDGFRFSYDETDGAVSFELGGVTLESEAGACRVNEWCHIAGTWDGSANATLFIDGIEVDSSASVSAVAEPASGLFFRLAGVPNSSPNEIWAHVDDLWVGPEMTAAQVCRACSAGIDGQAGECVPSSAATWEYVGYRNENCRECTLPTCNGPAP